MRRFNSSKLAVIVSLLLVPLRSVNSAKVSNDSANLSDNSYRTAYACEGSWLNVDCQNELGDKEEYYLDVIRANFGRFSISVCNDHGNTEWSVNCMSPRTLRVIEKQCDHRKSCSIEVTADIFGDPCPGTHKYVEVHYVCRKGAAPSASRPRRPPHWFPMPTKSTRNDSEVSLTGHGITPRVIEVRVPKPVNFVPRRTVRLPIGVTNEDELLKEENRLKNEENFDFAPHKNKGNEDEKETEDYTNNVEQSIKRERFDEPIWSSHSQLNLTDFCPPTRARGLFWNWTRSNQPAVQPCPLGSSGLARWSCGSDGVWSVSSPASLADCHSIWLADLDSHLQHAYSANQASNVSQNLAIFSNTELMHGGDLLVATRMLNRLVKAMAYHKQSRNLMNEEQSVTKMVQNVVSTASNMLDKANKRGWNDLSQSSARLAAADILRAVGEAASLLAEVVRQEKIIVKPTDNILLSVRVLSRASLSRQSFPSLESLDAFSSTHGNQLELDAQALLKATKPLKQVRLYFAAFNVINELLSVDDPELIVNAKIVSTSVSMDKNQQFSFEEAPLLISFKHIRTFNVTRPKCVSWDSTLSQWRTPYCRTLHSNRTHTLCACRVLSGHFGLLMSEIESDEANLALTMSTQSVKLSSRQVSTVIALTAAMVCVSVLTFFVISIVRKRTKMLDNCLFSAAKDLNESEKNGNRGNFYTVTPKLAETNVINSEAGPQEVSSADQQQFFEHMIQLQKNPQQDTMVSRRSQRTNNEETLNNRNNRASNRASLANFNHHIYMEIDNNTENYEPLSSETYVMSTLSDSSMGLATRLRTSSSSRDSRRPLINGNVNGNRSSLLQTISGVLSDHNAANPNHGEAAYPRMAARRSLMLHPSQHQQHVLASRTLGRPQLRREDVRQQLQQQQQLQHFQQQQHVQQQQHGQQHVQQHVQQPQFAAPLR